MTNRQENKSLQSKLFDSGAIEANDLEKIQQIKHEHRRAYQKSYQAEYRLKKKRLSVLFTPAQFQRLERSAYERGMGLGQYIRQLLEDAENKTSLINPLLSEVEVLDTRIIKLGNVFDSIVHKVDTSSGVSLAEIELVLRELSVLREDVKECLYPKNLMPWLEERSSTDPLFIPKLLEAISEFIKPSS